MGSGLLLTQFGVLGALTGWVASSYTFFVADTWRHSLGVTWCGRVVGFGSSAGNVKLACLGGPPQHVRWPVIPSGWQELGIASALPDAVMGSQASQIK